MIKETVKASKNTQMEIFMMGNFRETKPMVREFINGEMERFMMDNGIWGQRKDLEFGEVFKGTVISVSGEIVKLKVTESTFGRMVTSMKGNGVIV